MEEKIKEVEEELNKSIVSFEVEDNEELLDPEAKKKKPKV